MSVVNKFVNFMSMGSDDDEFENTFEDDGDYLDDSYDVPSTYENTREPEREVESSRAAKRYSNSSKVTPMKSKRGNNNNVNIGSGLEVCVIKPADIEEARTVTETLLQERAVVLNLEGLDRQIAQRIIDFTSGSCYAISGNLQQISKNIFIITPPSIEISGDFHDIFGGNNSEVSTI